MNGDIPAGRTFMELALKSEPNDIQLVTDLTVLEMRAGNFDKAQDYIFRGKKIAPDDKMLVEVEMMVERMQELSEKLKNRSN